MKARLTRDQDVRTDAPKAVRDGWVRQHLLGEITKIQLAELLRRRAKAGDIIDHPRAHRLVQMGIAEPADTECAIAANFTDKQITAAQLASEKIEAGNSLPESLAHLNADAPESDETAITGFDGEDDDDDDSPFSRQ